MSTDEGRTKGAPKNPDRAAAGAGADSGWVMSWAGDGEEALLEVTAGGAAVNAASLGLVRSMGFQVEEQWRSYERD